VVIAFPLLCALAAQLWAEGRPGRAGTARAATAAMKEIRAARLE